MRSAAFFLITFLMSETVIATATLHKRVKPQHAEDMIANDRGVEMNRDFTNMI